MSTRLMERYGLIGTFAGALAFYFLLSIIPLFILAATLVYTLLQVDIVPQLQDMLRGLLPPTLTNAPTKIGNAVHFGTSKGWFTLGFLGAVWASASFMNELARAIHLLFADHMDAKAGGWMRWLKSIGLMVLWCGSIVGVAILMLIGNQVREMLADIHLLREQTSLFSLTLRSLATFALLTAAVFATLMIVPRRKARWTAALWGSLGISLVWMLMGIILSRTFPIIWSQSALPVAFGSFLVTMFWSYACCWVLLVGALLVAHFGRRF